MKAQSAIEFLTTYGFLFAIIGVTLSFIAFLASSAASSVPSQCSSYAGPSCNFVSFYSNTVSTYSVVTLSITNTQSVPINITDIAVTVRGTTFAGACAPQLVYPGQQATCVAANALAPSIGSTVQGLYSIDAKYCNLGLSAVSKGNCAVPSAANYATVSYGGSFTTGAVQQQIALFSVAAAVGPSNFNGLSYNSFLRNNGPLIPLNYTIMQNGDWVTNVNSGNTVYAFSSSNSFVNTILGVAPGSFPQSVYTTLGTNNVACPSPFNSVLSLASTVIYLRGSTATANVVVITDNAIAVFIKPAPASNTITWNSVFGSNEWGPNLPVTQASNTFSLNGGSIYYLEVLWENTCGPGVQEFGFQWPNG